MQEIKLYSTDFCGFCVQAKRLFTKKNIDFTEINLQGQDELRMKLSQENGGWRTVPMIFIGDEFIGGYTELVALDRADKLQEKIERD